MILKYRMLSDENDNFIREFEVDATMNLEQFYQFIISSIGYQECMCSFYAADKEWNRKKEFTLLDMGDGDVSEDMPIEMSKITLGELILADYKKLIFQFDMIEDRAFYLELVSYGKPNPKFRYPRVAFEHATVPNQFDASAVSNKDGSIFEEMMDDFADFEGDDNYNDEY